MKDGMKDGMNRRDVLKLSVAAGVTLATGAVTKIAESAPLAKAPTNRPEHAKYQFLKSMNCSQAVLEAYAPSFGMSVEQARRVSAAFAGGMGMGTECGAVTGALMVVGLKYGKTVESDSHADAETSKRVTAFLKEFKARHKHLGCSELLGVDMGTQEGIKKAASKGYFTSRCPAYVHSAAEILEKVLA